MYLQAGMTYEPIIGSGTPSRERETIDLLDSVVVALEAWSFLSYE